MMETISLLIGAVAVVAFSVFIITYEVDKKDFNKGVCPTCGKQLGVFKKADKYTYVYVCPDDRHFHVATVGNPYLNLRYGRKLKKKGL